MKYNIELHPSAIEEIKEAFQWYESEAPGTGDRFIVAINERFSELASYPDRYAKRKSEFREVHARIFPYSIIYELFEKEKIIFVSYVFHNKRNPRQKYRRKR